MLPKDFCFMGGIAFNNGVILATARDSDQPNVRSAMTLYNGALHPTHVPCTHTRTYIQCYVHMYHGVALHYTLSSTIYAAHFHFFTNTNIIN